ncbi:MAG: competence/damage-inducible protein A [Nitrospiraceae bacterium]|nr:MAG: competence/damage-inducible protein A [Nitrospiraceae bacterium]
MGDKKKDTKTAGIIIIGNEILTGKVHDENSFFLTSELWSLGVQVKRVSIIPDEISVIAREVIEFSNAFTYVFTTGGVGPTHDDVTMKGIAQGFGVRLVQNPEIKNVLDTKFGSTSNDSVLKMADLPDKAEVIFHQKMRFPVVAYKNIYIFPGIPEYLRSKFSLIKNRFISSPFYLKRIFLNIHESEIAGILSDVLSEHNNVSIGSYPVVGDQDYRVVVTLESKISDSLNNAFNDLKEKLPEGIIVREE